nr:MFS transporter [Calothrix elsteri]
MWSPLRQPVFRSLWIASAISSVGTWMHDVGAAWLMRTLAPNSPILVALMQVAAILILKRFCAISALPRFVNNCKTL